MDTVICESLLVNHPTEFGLIDRFFKTLDGIKPTPVKSDGTGVSNTGNCNTHINDVGIGDDAAVLTPPVGQQLVITTDTLVSDRHFPASTSAYDIGYKSVAVNLSDLAAMGATPKAILLALSLPAANEAWLSNFTQGLGDICKKYHVTLIGGDTTQSDRLHITITALGFATPAHIVKRSTAQPNDVIVVSNQIGSAAYALQHILAASAQAANIANSDDTHLQPNQFATINNQLLNTLNRPEPQVELGQWLAQNKLAHAMIDISDGLAQDLQHILKQSDLSATLVLDDLPLNNVLQTLPTQQRFALALNGGDDYQLCFTCSEAQWQSIQALDSPFMLTKIGTVYSNMQPAKLPKLNLTYQNNAFDMPSIKGYQHF